MNNGTLHQILLRDSYEDGRRNEVILSAGTIESVKLLMLSGFGDRMELEDKDINVLMENKQIGRNLQDQLKFAVYFRQNDRFQVISKYEINKWKYKFFSGTMVNSSGFDGNMFYSVGDDGLPDLQFVLFNGIKPVDVYGENGELCMNTEIIDGVTIEIVLLHPKSKGFVKLKSDDPMDDMMVNPMYLSDERDLEILLKGYREIERVFIGKEPFDGTTTDGPFWPCGGDGVLDDERMKQYIRNNVQSNGHRVGTNSMGIVVDEELRLKDALNVRVVDGSVIPETVSGIGRQAPLVMMAEKIAGVILDEKVVSGEVGASESVIVTNDTSEGDKIPDHSEL